VTLAIACLCGFVLAWAAGANPLLLLDVRLRWTALVLAALAAQILLFAVHVRLPGGISTADAHLASYALLLVFAARNSRAPGFALAGLGLASNALVIFLNGGRMPVGTRAWADSAMTGGHAVVHGVYNNVAAASSNSHLAFLGDVFAMPHVLPFANTFSIGDVLLVTGATLFVYRNGRSNADKPSSRAFDPLRVPEFRALLAGRTISKLGDWISIAALVTWIYAHSHSTLGVSGILIARLTASIAGSLVSGAVLDRYGRFAVLARVEAARALTTIAAVAAVATGHLFAVGACVFLSSFLAAATDPAASSLVAEILPPERLHAGNALHAIARAVVMAIGSIAGGLMAAAVGAVPALLADSATFLAALLLYSIFARRSLPQRQVTADDQGPAKPTESRMMAFRFIRNSRRLTGLVASFAVATFAMGLLNASLPAFLSVHAPGSGGYGVAIGVIAVGLIFGEFLSGRMAGRVVDRIPALGFAISAGVVGIAALSNVPAMILLLLFALGVSDGTTETAYDTVVQAQTPQSLRGRVFAVAGAVQQSGMVAGFIAAPVVQSLFGGAALPTSSVALGGAALLGILVIGNRRAVQAAQPPRTTEAPWMPAARGRPLPAASTERGERARTADDLR
jgi:MFS family permease